MFRLGDLISHLDMSREEGRHLQQGMNFRVRPGHSVVLMSRRPDAPYADAVEDDGTIVYEGHDAPKSKGIPNPKAVDQPDRSSKGRLLQNGLFEQAAIAFQEGEREAERVRVYEKVFDGVWTYNGLFALTRADRVPAGERIVFKFRLEPLAELSADLAASTHPERSLQLVHARPIPTAVKRAVWQRDNGRCVRCGRTDNLHFDHILPYSKGGASITVDNVQILCAEHNLAKGARIE